MEKTTYKLADELISAEEARIKLRNTRNGVLGDLFTINKIIKEAVARGRPFIMADDLVEEVRDVLIERGYHLQQPQGAKKTCIIIDIEMYNEMCMSEARPHNIK